MSNVSCMVISRTVNSQSVILKVRYLKMSNDLEDQCREENPFSFRKFVKASGDRRESEEYLSGGGGRNDLALDPLDTFRHQNVHSTCENQNPFSFKKFLQSCDGCKEQIIHATCGTMTNDLPYFVKGYCVNDNRLPSNQSSSVAESYFHEVDLGSTCAKSHSSDCHQDTYKSTDVVAPKEHGSIMSKIDEIDKFARNRLIQNHVILSEGIKIESSLETCSVTTDCQNLHINLGEDKRSCHSDYSSVSDTLTYGSTACSAITVKDDHPEIMDGFVTNEDNRAELFIKHLQEENQELRRQLLETRAVAHKESARVKQLLKDIHNVHKHEADETAALEKMIQQVEGNLQATLQRAVTAENSVLKLKQEIKTLKNFSSSLVAENEILKSKNCNPLKEKSTFAAQQITAAATNAEQLLKQLLSGVDNLKMVAQVLSSMDQINDIPACELTDQ